ncbi:MAG: ABC transporter ATP-binding protein, partial [Firmicutes bacterium]|nr:ABC transporter ATP-binding protein [Bacillota bacterium]
MSLTEEIIRRLNPPAKVSGIVSYLWSKMGREGRLAVAALTGLLFPFLVQNPYYLRLGTLAGLYVLLSLGLNVVVGLAGLLDLGYIAFYAVGAYTYALLASPHFGWHLSFWVVLPLAALLAAGTGILLGFPSLRLKGDYLAIVTLGFGEIIRILLVNLDRPINITNGPNGLLRIDPPVFLGVPLVQPRQLFLLVWAFAALAILFSQRLAGSYIGRAWRALKEDETVASFQGINPTWYKLQAFAVGAFLAGLAGVFFAAWQGAVFPQNFTLAEVITIFAMVILGGSGNVLGVVAGAIILTVLPEALRQYSVYRMLIYGLALVLLIRFRPEGLWPAVNGERLDLARPENTGLAVRRVWPG